MGKIKKILENELLGGTTSNDVYPITSTQAVYTSKNEKLSDSYVKNVSCESSEVDVSLILKNESDTTVNTTAIPAATTERAGVMSVEDKKKVSKWDFSKKAYINYDGEIVPLNIYVATDFIKVKEGDVLFIEGFTEAAGYNYAFYNENKEYITNSASRKTGVVFIPEGVHYIVVSSNVNYEHYVKEATFEYANYLYELDNAIKQVGATNVYKHKADVGYSVGSSNTLKNYIVLELPNSKNVINVIELEINKYVLNGVGDLCNLMLAFFIESSGNLAYKAFHKEGSITPIIHILVSSEGNAVVAIDNVNKDIMPAYSSVFVKSYYSYFNAPQIVDKEHSVIFKQEDSLDDYELKSTDVVHTTPLTSLPPYHKRSLSHTTKDGYLQYSTYAVRDRQEWSGASGGAMVIAFPTYTAEFMLSVDIALQRYQTSGCTLRVSGFLTSSGFSGGAYVKLVEGKLATVFNKVRTGLKGGRAYIILGDVDVANWNFIRASIGNVITYCNTGTNKTIGSDWDIFFTDDISAYNPKDVDLTLDDAVVPNIPVSKIVGIEELKTISLSEYCNPHYIRTGLSEFFKKLYAKEKNTPYNLLFLGDSITNFQNGWVSGADKELPKVSNDKPLCMYNEYTFTNRLWALLNPNALDRANRNKVFGGNMTFIKATSDDVVKSGTWVNSYNYTTGQYNLPTIGGHPTGGIKDFLFSTDSNAYLEFTIPANSKGFSVVAEVQNGARTYNSTSYDPSTSVEVTLDGVLVDTISMIPESPYTQYQKRFDFVIASPIASTRKVRIQNKEMGKWVFIWGVESWTDSCVRPINNAFAGASMFSSGNYNNYVFAYTPDLIVHEANLLNDTRIDLVATEKLYDTFYSKLSEKGIPTLVLVTHAPSSSSTSITVDADKCPNMEDAEQTPRYYNQYAAMIKRVCGRYNIPYINVFQYQYDLYNGVIPSDLFVDGIHLSAKGYDMYKLLINYAFENNY